MKPGVAGQSRPNLSQPLLLLIIAVDHDAHAAGGRSRLSGSLLEFAQGAGNCVAVAQTRCRGQRSQRHNQRERFVPAQAQRVRDRVRVSDVDLAAFPGCLDEVIGQVPRRAADKQQLQVIDDLLIADPERLRCLGDVDPLVAHQPRHHREESIQAIRRGFEGHHDGPLPGTSCAASTARCLSATAWPICAGSMT